MTNYITENRALVEAVRNVSMKHDITYTVYSDDWIFRLEKDGKTSFIFAYAFDCNNEAAAKVAFDKVATYLLLSEQSIDTVPHHLIQTIVMPNPDTGLLQKLFAAHKDLVIKPLHGSSGKSVARFDKLTDAISFMQATEGAEWCASPLIDIDREIRVVVFKGVAQLAYEKYQPVEGSGVKMFNLNLGAKARGLDVASIDPDIERLAVNALKTVGLELGAVDIVVDASQKKQVLEINCDFSLEHFAKLSQTNRAQVVELYERIIPTLFHAR